ncbi:hypothetical protein PSECIP111951_02774 [Pseudoalteromonas holothuriae]|uniref:DUF4178 domain-containing protein n=1 Tax=Pseudoalteromonas holothuriae TaxID=2963714 RepID=A0ABM9GKR1_9GAMM|nr:hypothetical protein [Pseudoalteromonas sp. CIP111951]CAH9062808.1 hypothetical protein PSECIP111951_02774 [Pseudoalteromonas sp. CIP111951]
MFNFFKKNKAPTRQLSEPTDLVVGDMLTLIDSFAYPQWLKGETLRVVAVNTYQYQHSAEYEMVLESNSGQVVFLQIGQEDGEQWANFSIKIQREDVDDIFTLDEFSLIFDEESLTQITVANIPERFSQFLATSYTQTQASFICYFHEKDYRGQSLPQYEQPGTEACEMICLASNDGNHSLNIEIWDGGETDVSLTLTRPLSDIVELFPGSD